MYRQVTAEIVFEPTVDAVTVEFTISEQDLGAEATENDIIEFIMQNISIVPMGVEVHEDDED